MRKVCIIEKETSKTIFELYLSSKHTTSDTKKKITSYLDIELDDLNLLYRRSDGTFVDVDVKLVRCGR